VEQHSDDEPARNPARVASSGRIDVHAHCVPPEWHEVPAAAAPLFRGFTSWSIPSALEMMDRQGIATAVLSMVFWSGLFADADDVAAARRLARSSNEVAAEAVRSHPDRFGGFACLPLPDVDGALAEIDYGLGTLGLDGVVLLTNANGVYLGDSRLDPVFDELNRRSAAVFLHPTLPACVDCTSLGYAPSLIEFVFDTTRAVTHLVLSGTLERCPDLRLIVPHAGGTIPYLVERIGLIAPRWVPGATDRAPAGVKAYFRRLYYELAISTSPHAVASVLQLADPERILFGSDFPAMFEEDVQTLVKALVDNPLLQPGDLEMIERRNALQLFPRLRRPNAAVG
jgi:predicted TIM-barrel fold metal-dependent hydrolase